MKRVLVCLAALALLGVTSPISVSVHVERTSLDLLDVLSIGIVAHNPGKSPAIVRFPLPEEYAIDVLHGSDVIWSSPQASPPPGTVQSHTRAFVPGPTTMAIYAWNELTKNGSSLAAGDYTIRVRLLDGASQAATTTIRFVMPVPVESIAHLKPGDEITLAGTVDNQLLRLTDATGSVTLSRRLIGFGNGPVAVRGSIMLAPGGSRILNVERWAPLSSLQP